MTTSPAASRSQWTPVMACHSSSLSAWACDSPSPSWSSELTRGTGLRSATASRQSTVSCSWKTLPLQSGSPSASRTVLPTW